MCIPSPSTNQDSEQVINTWSWIHINGDQKKAGVAILISDKIDFEIKAVKTDKEEHYIMIKGSIQEDITIINMHPFI